MSKSKPPVHDEAPPQPSMDEVLRRMLSTPPKHHKDERVNPKPVQKKPKPD